MDRARNLVFGIVVALSATVGGCTTAAGPRATPPSVATASALSASTKPSAAMSTVRLDPTAIASPTQAVARDGEPWIVYQGGSSPPARVRLVRPDGTDDHVLDASAPNGTHEEAPDWSPDGSMVAYTVWSADTVGAGQDHIEIWMIRADGTDARQVTTCEVPCQQLSYPAWSPDRTSLAMVRFDGGVDGASHLQVMDLTTGKIRILVESADGTVAFHGPRWSPDGRTISFTDETYADAMETELLDSAIATIASDGSDGGKPTILAAGGPWEAAADWHPAGDRLVLAEWPTGTDGTETGWLATIAPDGSHVLAITSPRDLGGAAIQPTWTKDGSRIQFTFVAPGGAPEAATIAADGSELTRMPPAGGLYRTHPRLRPTP